MKLCPADKNNTFHTFSPCKHLSDSQLQNSETCWLSFWPETEKLIYAWDDRWTQLIKKLTKVLIKLNIIWGLLDIILRGQIQCYN